MDNSTKQKLQIKKKPNTNTSIGQNKSFAQ